PAPLYINLDAIESAPLAVIRVDGKEHKLVSITVEDFIANFKDVERLSLSASVLDEVEVLTSVILRGFPTLKRESVLKWPMEYLQRIAMVVRNGGIEELVDTEATAGNGQPAS